MIFRSYDQSSSDPVRCPVVLLHSSRRFLFFHSALASLAHYDGSNKGGLEFHFDLHSQLAPGGRNRIMSATASQKQGESEPGSGSITIDVTSDFACPWCYVGFKRLENAMQLAKDKSGAACSFQIRWHPYMIDARTQLDGEPYLEYNRRRWGGDGWVAGMKRDCAADGCRFENWGRQNPRSVWAHTLHAHRLMHYVQREYGDAAGHALKRRLFHEYYEKGRNISLVDEVADIGREFVKKWQAGEGEQGVVEGVDSKDFSQMRAAAAKAVDEYMRSEKQEDGYEDVLNADKKAKKRGVSGVPYFDVKGVQRGFSGAQPTEFWSDLFEQMA